MGKKKPPDQVLRAVTIQKPSGNANVQRMGSAPYGSLCLANGTATGAGGVLTGIYLRNVQGLNVPLTPEGVVSAYNAYIPPAQVINGAWTCVQQLMAYQGANTLGVVARWYFPGPTPTIVLGFAAVSYTGVLVAKC
jgi:hypothetical protein